MLSTYNNALLLKDRLTYEQFASLAAPKKAQDLGSFEQFVVPSQPLSHMMAGDWRRRWGITSLRFLSGQNKVVFDTRGAPAQQFMESLNREFSCFGHAELHFVAPAIRQAGRWTRRDGLMSLPADAGATYEKAWDQVFGMPLWLQRPRKSLAGQYFYRVELRDRAEEIVYSDPSSHLSVNDALLRGLAALRSSLHRTPPQLGELAIVTGPYSLRNGPAPDVQELSVLLDEEHLESAAQLASLP
ncbi:MAG: hypothetical protein JHD15_17110 [Phenylobacterium sp.]|uniref:hypothetical protein n=1 Tax=Phenylobacterium sp. TaxID=1871053 RepID=UPI001A2F0A06|nr:hypothetical protein [Phenylobacterium sp.]MBJ7412066.1 hypothetical protein [Phenylobacterium sp.]